MSGARSDEREEEPGASGSEHPYRIGQIAELVQTSTRTLRYYDQLGLVQPSGYTKGGSRRYTDADLERFRRVRELQAVMGFNLEEIAAILSAEQRLAELQQEYRQGASQKRKKAIVVEVARLNARTRERVDAKLAVLHTFKEDLEEAAERYRVYAAENGFALPTSCEPDRHPADQVS